MIRFIQKLVILWEKSKFLTLMEMESRYIELANDHILSRDLNELRTEMAKLKALKKATPENQRKIIQIESEINESEKYAQMITSSREKGEDLRRQISMYRAELWK